ncbi:hypothetical protein HU200_006918 [Digitaria exilis]|uniref:FMN hydroxy acid dehydrogenase domain-containing protein n=1 Tax=Digitaria exilis TaxID=1010633 RepID=A0A835FR89_9POAL|nr:hypothetical protein HU200_006918 [Digitaria exilis]
MGEITNVMEYQAIAKQKLPKMAYDYYVSGAEDEWTLKQNREAFSRILFRPRILIDVSKIDMTTSVLGFKISMRIMIAPTAFQKMAHPDGEYATARAASAAGTIMVHKDRKVVEQLVRTAERAGFKAIALHRGHPTPRPPRSRHQEPVCFLVTLALPDHKISPSHI